MRLLSVSEMKALEQAGNAAGYLYSEMMIKAGTGIAQRIHARFSNATDRVILGLVGKGNNGGDTLVALTVLEKMGWQTYALLFSKRSSDDTLLTDYLAAGGKTIAGDDLDLSFFSGIGCGLILDGLYGTGFRLPMNQKDKKILAVIKEKLPSFSIIAVDCPSGMDCQSGEVDSATLKADVTYCLEAVKKGMITSSAVSYCGEIESVDLNLSKYNLTIDFERDTVAGIDDVNQIIPIRDESSHKGTFGKVMVVGGSVNYPGAPILAGNGAYAVGAGLVQTAVPEPVFSAAAASHLELTWLILDDQDGVISENAATTLLMHASKADSLVLGPGLGREDTTFRFIQGLLFENADVGRSSVVGFVGVGNSKTRKEPYRLPPMVIDADALFLMSRVRNWAEKLKYSCILTPHPGEMSILTGLAIEEIQSNRVEIARRYAQQWQQTLVLKGALTVIAFRDGKTVTIPVATSALAKAGTGDVLAGMIGGLLAQGVDTKNAAVAGTWMHAHAGLAAGKMLGANECVIARDLIRAIPLIYQKFRRN